MRKLKPTELRILTPLCAGATLVDIARAEGIATSTIHTKMQHLREHYKADTNIHLVTTLIAMGLLVIDKAEVPQTDIRDIMLKDLRTNINRLLSTFKDHLG